MTMENDAGRAGRRSRRGEAAVATRKQPLVFLVFGGSVSGKSLLCTEIARLKRWMTIHIKGTDRRPRQYDGPEMRCVRKVRRAEYDYTYHTYGHAYGIQRLQIAQSLGKGKHHFIIVNDLATIRRLKHDLGHKVRVVFLYFTAPRETIRCIHRQRGISDDEIELRLQKIDALYRAFLREPEVFDYVIVNRFGAPPGAMLSQLYMILAAEGCGISDLRGEPADHGLTSVRDAVRIVSSDMEQRRGQEVVQPGFFFVVMPMDRRRARLSDELRAIKRAVERRRGRHAARIDDMTPEHLVYCL